MDTMFWVVVVTVLGSWTALVYAVSWAMGHKRGMRDGFAMYVRKLRFERRDEAVLLPTDQPHARRPKGHARVSTAHMSQVRRHWNPDA